MKRQALEVEARLVAAKMSSAADKEVSDLMGDEPPSAGIPGIDDDLLFSSYQEGEIAIHVIFFMRLFIIISLPVFGPIVRLSPPPSDRDYCFNLDESEGVMDLFDIKT